MSKNLYEILEVEQSASLSDIKKAYKRLVLVYHPDKNNMSTSDKFIDVQNAYTVLSNLEKRKSYDSLSLSQQNDFYDNIKIFLQLHINKNIDEYIKLFFKEESQVRDYINKMDFSGLFKYATSQFADDNYNYNCDSQNEKIISVNADTNISGNIYVSFEDKYNDRYRKIKVLRKTKEPFIGFVPLREYAWIFYEEGEYCNVTNKHGNIILNIQNNNDVDENITIVNNNIYVIKYISLYEYLYKNKLSINIFGKNIDCCVDNLIENMGIVTLENMGMPFSKNKKCDNSIFNTERGNLCIIHKIHSLDILEPFVKKLCEENI